MQVGRAAGRTDQRAHVEVRGAALDQEAGGVRERQGEQVARRTVFAEDIRGEARDEGGITRDGERVDSRRRGERRVAGQAGVIHAAHGVRQGGHLHRGEGAGETVVGVAGQEALAEAGDGRVGEDVAADRHHVGIAGTEALAGREARVIQEDGRETEAREIAESGDDEGAGGLDHVDGHRGRRRGVGADDEAGGVGDGGDRRAGGDAGAAHAHARDEAAGAGDDDVGRGVGGRRARKRAVGEGQRREVQAHLTGGVRAQLDAAAAVLDREGRDRFGGVAGGGTEEGKQAALHVDEAADARAETVVAVGRRVIEQQRAADVDVEGRLGRVGRDEGRAVGAGVGQRAAADGDRAERARSRLGRGQGQRARADLVDQREGHVVEAHEATREGRVDVVEADVERGITQRAEDVARTGETTPGGVLIVEIEARAGVQDEGREARAGVGHAGADAARGDGEVGTEEGLGAEIEHAVAGLGDAAGRADDGLEGERRTERVDIGEAADRDRGDVDRVRRGAEVHAAFEERDRGDVGRGGMQAARADGQDAAGTVAAGLVVREAADVAGSVGAVVIERQLAEGVVTEEDDRAVAVDGDLVAEGDGVRTVGQELACILPGTIDDEALRGVGRQRQGVGAGPKHELTGGDGRATGVGVGSFQRPGVGSALRDGHVDAGRVHDVGAHHVPAAALGVEEELVAAGSHIADAGSDADELGLRAPGHEATGTQGQGPAGGDVEGLAGLIGETQRIDRQVAGDRVRDGRSRVEADVRGGVSRQHRIGVRRGVGIARESRGAHRADAEFGSIGREVVRAGGHGAEDGPAAEDAVGQRDRGAVDGAEGDAVRRARGEVGDRARATDEVVDRERDGVRRRAAAGDDELRTTGDEVDGAEGLGTGRLVASAEFEERATEIDGGVVGDAVEVVLQAVLVVQVEQRGVDVQGAGVGEGRVAIHHDGAAVEGGHAGVAVVAPQVERALARAGEADVAGRAGRELAGIVVGVDQEVTGAAVAGDRGAAVGDDGFGEGAAEELREAVEVQGTADGREVIVGLEGVGAAELDRTLVEHEQTAHRVDADGAQARDRGARRVDGQRTLPCLDERRAAVADAGAARHRGADREVAERPDVQRGSGGRGLVEDAAGDDRGAARADQDAAGTEGELHAVGEGETGAALDREGVALGVRGHRQAGAAGGGEQDVGVRHDALGGAAEGRRVDVILGDVQRTDVAVGAAGGGEGQIGREGARVVQVDDGPRQDAAVLGAGAAAFTGEGRGVGELDGSTAGERRQADAAEEHGDARSRARGLGRSLVTPARAAEEEDRLREGEVLLPEADLAEALEEGRVGEVLDGRRAGAGRTDEVQRGATEGDVAEGAGARAAHAALGEVHGAVVETQGRADVQEDARAPRAVGVEEHGAVADGQAVLVGLVDDFGDVRGRDAERAGAELLDGVEAGGAAEAHLELGELDVTVGREDEVVVGDGVLDAAEDAEGRTGVGADDRAVRQGQEAGDGVDAGDALELAAGVDAALGLAARALQGDRIGEREAADELEGGAARGGGRRDGDRTGARGLGVQQADDAAVDVEAAGPAGVGDREDERARAVLGEDVARGREDERIGDGERVAQRDVERAGRGVEVELTVQREGARDTETGGGGAAVGDDGHAVAGGAEGGVTVDGEASGLDEHGLPCPAEAVDAVEHERASAVLDEAEAGGAVGDRASHGERIAADGDGDGLAEGDRTCAEVIRLGAGEGEAGVPGLGVGARVDEGRAGGVVEGDTRAEHQRAGAEGGGVGDVDGTEGDVQSARAGAGTGKGQGAGARLGDGGGVGDAAGEGQRGTVGAGAVDRPSLDAERGERRGDRDDARVGLDFDAVVRAAGEDGQRAARARSDGERRDSGRSGREDEAVDGTRSVEGRGEGGAGDERGAEVQGVGHRRKGRDRGGAGEVLRPGGEVAPRGTRGAVEVTVDHRAGGEDERGAAGGVETVVKAYRSSAQDPGGEIQAAVRGQERVSARRDAAEIVQVEGDETTEARTGAELDRVIGARGAEVEAEAGTVGEAEDGGAERDGGSVEEVEGRAAGDVDGGSGADREAGAEHALGDREGAAVQIDRAGDGHATETGLGEVGLGDGTDRAVDRQGGETVGDVEGRAGGADGNVLGSRGRGRGGLDADARVGEHAAVDEDGAGAQVGALREGEGARVDAQLSREGVGAGERDDARGGLHHVGGAAEDRGDGTGAEVEVLGRGQDAGGAVDGAGAEADGVDGLIEGGDVERTAVHREGGRGGQGVGDPEGHGAGVDERAGEAVDARERERARADLGHGGRGAGDGTRDDDVAGAAEGERAGTRGDRGGARERQRARVGLDEGVAGEGDRAGEGIGSVEIAEGARGADAGAAEGDRFRGDVGAALELERRAVRDDGVTDGGAEGRGRGRGEGARVDDDRAVEGVRTAQGELARAVLGEIGGGARDGAADDDVARAVERQGMGVPGEGTAQREATGLGTDERGAAEGDRAAEGVGAAEVAQRAVGGKAGAENGEGLGADSDAAAQFEGRTVGHGRAAGDAAEGGRVADGQEAGVDGGRARVGAGAGQHDRAGTTEGQAAGARDGVVGGVGARAVDDERGVVDDRADAEGARRRARADLEGAAGDGEDAGEAVEAFEDEGVRGGLAERAAAVDFGDVAERAGLEAEGVDRTGERADGEAVQVQRGVGEAQRRSDGGEAVADALGDRVADVDRAAGDVERGDRGAVDVGGTAEADRSVDGDVAARNIDRTDRGVVGVGRGIGRDVQAGRADEHGTAGDIERGGRGTCLAAGAPVTTVGDVDGGGVEDARAEVDGRVDVGAVGVDAAADIEGAEQEVRGTTGEVRQDGRISARIIVHPADVHDRAAGAGAVTDDQAALRCVKELQGRAAAVAAELDGVDVEGIDPGAEAQDVRRHAGRRGHVQRRRDDRARRGQGDIRAGAAAGTAVIIGGIADTEGAAREARIEGGQAGHVDHGTVGYVRRGVGAHLDVDQRGITHAADQEGTAAGEAQTGIGDGAGVEADGDRAVDLQGVARADGDDVIGDRVTVTDGQAAETGAAVGEVEGRDDRRVGDIAEDERAVRVELVGRGDADGAGAAEDDRTVARDDVAGRQDVAVGAGEEDRTRVVDEPATDGTFVAEGADLDGGRSTDGRLARVGVGTEEGDRPRTGEGDTGLARAGTEHVLDREGQGGGAARVSQERVVRGAAVADPLVGGDRAGAEVQGGDGLVEAAEVEATDGADAAQGQGADGEGVVRAEERGAVGDDGSAGVGVGATEGQRAAARVADGDAGVRGGFDEGAAEGDGAGAGEGQGRRADRAVAHGLVGGDAGSGEALERLAEAVELEGRAVAGAAEHHAIGIGPGRSGADHERAVLDAGEAGVTVSAGQRQDAAGGHAADEVAGAVDVVGEGQGAGAGDDEAAAVGDDGGRRQGARGAAVAQLQGGSGSDRGRPLIDVGAREHEGARVDGEAAETADDGTDGGRTGGVDAQRTVDVDDTGAGDRAAGAEREDLAHADEGAAVMAEVAGDGQVAAAEDGDGTQTGSAAGIAEVIRTIEGEQRSGGDGRGAERPTLPHLERAGGHGGAAGERVGAGEHEGACAGLGEGERADAAVGEDAGEGLRARGDADGERRGRRGDAVDDAGGAGRGVRGETGEDEGVAGETELTGRAGSEGDGVARAQGASGFQGKGTRAVEGDVAGEGVGRAEDERAAVDREASGDGLRGLEHEGARVDGHAAGEVIAGVGERGLGGAVLDDAGVAGDAEVAGEGVSERGVVEREARRRHGALADHDGTNGGIVVEDDGVADLEIGRSAARDDAEVLGAGAGGAGGDMPDVVGDTADVALPADGDTADEDGELGRVARDDRARLTAAETGDRADGEGVEIRERGGEVGQQVGAVGEGAAVDGGDRDGTVPAVGEERADVHDRRRGAEVDVTEAEGGEVARGRAEDEVADRQAARDAVAGFDDAAVGDVDRALESARSAQDGVGRHVGRDVRAGAAAEGKRAAVDVDRDRAGQGGGRAHRERAGARLDELAGAGTGDRAAEGGVGSDGQFAVGSEEDRAACGARAFKGGDGLDRAVEVEGRAGHVGQTDGGGGREGIRDAGTERAAVEGGLDGVGLGDGEGPHPCPALREGSRVDEVRGQGAVAGAGEHEGAVDAVRAAGVEAARRAVQGEHARVGTQGERAAVRRTKADRPGVGAGDVLEERRGRVDTRVGDATRELETGAGGDGERGGAAEGARVRKAQGAGVDDGGAGVGVGRAEGRDAEAFLGQAGRAEGDRTAEDEVARAAQRQGMVSRGNRPAERERAGFALEAGGAGEDDGSAQGIGAGKITEHARAEAAAGQEERLVAGDITEDAQGGAGGDHGLARGAAEAGRAAEVDGARVDVGHAGVVRRTGEGEHAGAVLVERESAEEAVVDRAAEGGIGRGEGGEHRTARLEAGVGDDAARTGERADRGAARAEDVEDAAVDGHRAVEAGVAAERVGVADTQGAGVDGRASGVGVDARERLHAGPVLDEREVAGDLTGVSPVTREDTAVVGDDVDRQGGRKARSIGDDTIVAGLGAEERPDGLAETVEVDGRGAGGTDVHDRTRRHSVVRAEAHDRGLIGEVIVVGVRVRIGEPDVADAHGDHLAGSRGHATRDVQGAAVGTEEAAGEGRVLDVDRARQGADAGGRVQEDGGFTAATAGELDVDRIGEGHALFDLELTRAD